MRVLEEPARAGEIGFQNNRDHSAKRAHLFLRQLMLRMLFQARVVNLFDLRLLLEPACDLESVLAMPFHSQSERLQTTEREKAIKRSRNRADRVLQKRDLVAELLVFPDHNHAADH